MAGGDDVRRTNNRTVIGCAYATTRVQQHQFYMPCMDGRRRYGLIDRVRFGPTYIWGFPVNDFEINVGFAGEKSLHLQCPRVKARRFTCVHRG